MTEKWECTVYCISTVLLEQKHTGETLETLGRYRAEPEAAILYSRMNLDRENEVSKGQLKVFFFNPKACKPSYRKVLQVLTLHRSQLSPS